MTAIISNIMKKKQKKKFEPKIFKINFSYTDESNFLVINGTIEDVAAMLIKAMRNLR
jgi:hypothetical protein